MCVCVCVWKEKEEYDVSTHQQAGSYAKTPTTLKCSHVLIVASFPGSLLAPTKNFCERRAWERGYIDRKCNTWWLHRMATARFALLYESNFLGTGSFSAEQQTPMMCKMSKTTPWEVSLSTKYCFIRHHPMAQCELLYQASYNGPVWTTICWSIVIYDTTCTGMGMGVEWEWDTCLLWAHQVAPVTFLKRWTYEIPVHTKRITVSLKLQVQHTYTPSIEFHFQQKTFQDDHSN